MKDTINRLETDSKNKNIRNFYRGISEFKKGYQPKTNLVKDEKGGRLGDSRSIVNRWRNNLSVIELHGVNYVRQTEIHTAEPLVPEPMTLRLRWLLRS